MTKELVKILFPLTKNVDEVVGVIDKYKDKFGLQTSLRLGHFLVQVREEIGSEFKVLRENLNYREEVLPKLFKNFTIELAEKYGRDEDTPVADQVAIANIAYANKLGNGKADSNSNGRLDRDDDGWKYRGAGCLQITGKSNFNEVQKRCVKYAGREFDPDTLEGFIVFGMAYWIWKDLYRIADKGASADVVNDITKVINKYTHSYEHRVAHFNSVKPLLSKVQI